MKKFFITTTIPRTLNFFKGNLNYLSEWFEVCAISSKPEELQQIDFIVDDNQHVTELLGYEVKKNTGAYPKDNHLWFKIFAAGHKLYMMNECLYKMRDDRNATARRNWLARRNECYVRHIGFQMIGLPCFYQIYALVPILKYIAPRFIYNYFHRK